jgi:hypothetical protein
MNDMAAGFAAGHEAARTLPKTPWRRNALSCIAARGQNQAAASSIFRKSGHRFSAENATK